MLRFRGFKASLDLASGKGSGIDHIDKSPGVSITGAYRINRDEVSGSSFTYPDPPKKITPSMVKLPNSQSTTSVKLSESVNNLTRPNETANIRKNTSNIPQTNTNEVKLNKTQIKEQKKLEKQRLAEQKKREKIAAREQQKEEKLRKEREKQVQAKKVQEKNKEKNRPVPKAHKTKQLQTAPQSQSAPPSQRVPQQPSVPQPQSAPKPQSTSKQQNPSKQPSIPQQQNVPQHQNTPKSTTAQANPQTQRPVTYPTNTLESSISRSSGPPPYTSMPEVIQNQNDDTGNTSFAKPAIDSGSWDLISQHRQQINRPTGVSKSVPKQKHLDLHYNVGNSKTTDNSEA